MINDTCKFLRVVTLLTILTLAWSCSRAEVESIELRIMSYNIAAGNGNISGIADVIEEYQPDIVALQESSST